jgi:hypothetical protein
MIESLSLPVRSATCGDINPDRPTDVFASISFGWPCRWPPTSAVPAIHCFARPLLGRPDSVSGAFSFFAGQSLFSGVPDDERKYIRQHLFSQSISQMIERVIHRLN